MRSPIRFRSPLVLAGALAVTLLAVPSAGAQPNRFPEQPPPQISIPAGGTELLRALLDRERIDPVRAFDAHRSIDRNTIVIAVGNPESGDWSESLAQVRRAISVGGAALIATDSGVRLYEHNNTPNTNNPIGAFSGQVVMADRQNPQHTYRSRSDCPIVVPISPDEVGHGPERPGRVWNVFRGLKRVATNQPTFYVSTQFRQEYQHPLARLPKSSHTDNWRLRDPIFAVGGDGPDWFGTPGYSFLAMADSSVFINQMLMETDTDNLELTLRTIEYLQGPDKARNKCLFYENGRVIEKFDGLRHSMAKPLPKIPPDAMPNLGGALGKNQDKIIDMANGFADQLQNRDAIHNMLVGESGSERERNSAANWIERAAVLASIAAILFLIRRLWNARHPQDTPPAPITGAGTASTGPPGVFDRRQKELVRRNNVYEPVRQLTREFFASAGAPENPGPQMPNLEISGAVRKPGSLRQALRDMWRLAYGPPTAMSAQRWFELEPYFERLKQAHADEKWRFVPNEV
ncbi:unnamed protein product [Gemmata massiliana]|uniref:DUF4350 domain-containing protein n=1 Tax=Gemmata massiliana TaxID=1210884 RepID=A0A6P2D2Q4_9BACT|nr:hypothetical protein [Gemmata massiliana]VTR94374.1 unnamed protein product [Gemmata massiliana]